MGSSKKTKNIYIVLTYTGTVLSKIIKYYTTAEYSHVSIALDKELEEIYSFGRLNPYNPFIGGFVKEGIERGTFKRFKNTKALVYAVPVTEEQYEIIENTIKHFKANKDEYKFNVVGLFAIGLNIRYTKENSFYCAEFVKHVIDKANLEFELPEMIKPDDFKALTDLEITYKGKLRNYKLINKVEAA